MWRGGSYDLVRADVLRNPPSSLSELMRGFLVLFLASQSWRTMRGWRRERREKKHERNEEEEMGWRRGGWIGLVGAPMRTWAAAQHKALNRDQTGKKNRERERRVTLCTCRTVPPSLILHDFCNDTFKSHRPLERSDNPWLTSYMINVKKKKKNAKKGKNKKGLCVWSHSFELSQILCQKMI